jgi:hypothetical protein
MQIPTTFKRTSLLIVLCTTFSFSTSFISGNKDKQGPDDPVKLVYIFDQSKSIPYFSAIKVTQTMEVNGQTVHNLVENYLAFKVNLLGSAADTLNLGIKVDSLFTKVETMEGTTGGKIKDVMGKTFNMILSPRGKEINIDEAKKIEYPVEGSPNANISTFFANIFPDLP